MVQTSVVNQYDGCGENHIMLVYWRDGKYGGAKIQSSAAESKRSCLHVVSEPEWATHPDH